MTSSTTIREALDELDRAADDVRVVKLQTETIIVGRRDKGGWEEPEKVRPHPIEQAVGHGFMWVGTSCDPLGNVALPQPGEA